MTCEPAPVVELRVERSRPEVRSIRNRFYTFAFFAFAGTMASLAALATRNFTTFFAGILIAAPVAGFRPIRAFLSDEQFPILKGKRRR